MTSSQPTARHPSKPSSLSVYRELLVETEAQRYGYLEGRTPGQKTERPKRKSVLILGDFSAGATRRMLDLLVKAAPLIGQRATYTIKPHPNHMVNAADYQTLGLTIVTDALAGILDQYDVAYASNNTSAAVDAYFAGVPVAIGFDDEDLNFSPLRGRAGIRFVATPEELARSDRERFGQFRHASEDFFHLDASLPRWKRLLGRNDAGAAQLPAAVPPANARHSRRAEFRAARRMVGVIAPGGRRRSFTAQVVERAAIPVRREEPRPPRIPVAPPVRALTLSRNAVTIQDDSLWSERFPDIEETVAVHRLELAAPRDNRRCGPTLARRRNRAHAIMDWGVWRRAAVCAQAYTTGEFGAANAGLFLLLTGDGSVPDDIAAELRVMATQIARHLEYQPSGLTGNHALNNGRGLLFAGLVGGSPAAVTLARAVIEERLPRVVTADGLLREGSSHYHFLLTRWLLEMHWLVSRYGQHDIAGFIEPFAREAVERCWFFLVQDRATGDWHFPLIGDVSPDFPPEWLISLPWSAPACRMFRPKALPAAPVGAGWADLFGIEAGHGGAAAGSEHLSDSGMVRIERGPWTFSFALSRGTVASPRITVITTRRVSPCSCAARRYLGRRRPPRLHVELDWAIWKKRRGPQRRDGRRAWRLRRWSDLAESILWGDSDNTETGRWFNRNRSLRHPYGIRTSRG